MHVKYRTPVSLFALGVALLMCVLPLYRIKYCKQEIILLCVIVKTEGLQNFEGMPHSRLLVCSNLLLINALLCNYIYKAVLDFIYLLGQVLP